MVFDISIPPVFICLLMVFSAHIPISPVIGSAPFHGDFFFSSDHVSAWAINPFTASVRINIAISSRKPFRPSFSTTLSMSSDLPILSRPSVDSPLDIISPDKSFIMSSVDISPNLSLMAFSLSPAKSLRSPNCLSVCMAPHNSSEPCRPRDKYLTILPATGFSPACLTSIPFCILNLDISFIKVLNSSSGL